MPRLVDYFGRSCGILVLSFGGTKRFLRSSAGCKAIRVSTETEDSIKESRGREKKENITAIGLMAPCKKVRIVVRASAIRVSYCSFQKAIEQSIVFLFFFDRSSFFKVQCDGL